MNKETVKTFNKKKIYSNWRCEKCGELAEHIHHKNRNRNDNSYENLIFLCRLCHAKQHIDQKYGEKPSSRKYHRMSLKEISIHTGLSTYVVMSFFRNMPISGINKEKIQNFLQNNPS